MANNVDTAELFRTMPARYPELRGQVAIVTGSGRGIGAAIATRMAREGMRVVIAGLDPNEVETTSAALRGQGADTLAVPGDLRQGDEITRLFDLTLGTFGALHLLVNNAGDLRRVHSTVLTEALIDDELALNTRTPLLCALRAVEVMRPLRVGSIVNISSVGGLRAQLPGLPYGMTKGALDALTRVLAVDLAGDGIRVNAVAPGWTPKGAAQDAERVRQMSAYIPLRRPGRPEDIAAMVAFLASSDASYITGQILYVDGGLTAQLHPPEHPI